MLIGVLAVQGAFIEHRKMLYALGVESVELRQSSHLEHGIDGLILPGGESTTMGKLLHELKLFSPLQQKIAQGLPTFGTCAGMILLAKHIHNDARCHFATMDVEVTRNAYGRQLASFNTKAHFAGKEIEMPFIRAPYITQILDENKVEVLSEVQGKIVAARQGNQLVTAFHPEVTTNSHVHEYFLNMVRQYKKKKAS